MTSGDKPKCCAAGNATEVQVPFLGAYAGMNFRAADFIFLASVAPAALMDAQVWFGGDWSAVPDENLGPGRDSWPGGPLGEPHQRLGTWRGSAAGQRPLDDALLPRGFVGGAGGQGLPRARRAVGGVLRTDLWIWPCSSGGVWHPPNTGQYPDDDDPLLNLLVQDLRVRLQEFPPYKGHSESMTTTRKKLIEVSMPLEAINVASAREKSIRHGHPSTLHLWWARRPLAACRALLFAQLVDDPLVLGRIRFPHAGSAECGAGAAASRDPRVRGVAQSRHRGTRLGGSGRWTRPAMRSLGRWLGAGDLRRRESARQCWPTSPRTRRPCTTRSAAAGRSRLRLRGWAASLWL